MSKIIYPEDYDDELKAIYDSLIAQGTQLIGKKIKPQDEFLLDLSAKITINQMRGIDNNLTMEEIEEMKAMHKKNMGGEFDTPAELYEGGMIRLENGEESIHPLAISQEEVFDKTRIAPPKIVDVPEPADEECDVKILTDKVDEMLEIN
jgi:hypothetical protein